jgi:hypothetical protein
MMSERRIFHKSFLQTEAHPPAHVMLCYYLLTIRIFHILSIARLLVHGDHNRLRAVIPIFFRLNFQVFLGIRYQVS